MLFHSFPFILFFICFWIIYRNLSKAKQNISLLIAGIIFYSSWDFRFLFLLLFCIGFNYYAGNLIFGKDDPKKKRSYAFVFIFINIFILCIFKYFGFFLDSLNWLCIHLGYEKISSFSLILPLGISFFTFHNISYIMDLYSGKIEPAKNLLEFSIYDLFFPLLLAGPIERPDSLIPQIRDDRVTNRNKILSGILLFSYGVFKKVVIADQLAVFTEKLMDINYYSTSGLFYWGGLFMAFQVYADFSGYSDCARGLAKILGFELRNNFLFPFLAKNPPEFWQRWHISLSSWLKDYLYIPLGGNRKGRLKEFINLFIVWSIGGIWHGVGMGYLLWGWYCGAHVATYHFIKNLFNHSFFESIFFIWITRFFLTLSFGLGLLLFKIHSMEHIFLIIQNLLGFYWNGELLIKFLVLLFPLVLVESYQVLRNDPDLENVILLAKWKLFIVFTFLLQFFFLFASDENKEFFYFQF